MVALAAAVCVLAEHKQSAQVKVAGAAWDSAQQLRFMFLELVVILATILAVAVEADTVSMPTQQVVSVDRASSEFGYIFKG
jgi:hypothetical protein